MNQSNEIQEIQPAMPDECGESNVPTSSIISSIRQDSNKNKIKDMKDQFSRDIQIDFIENTPYRILCRHIDVMSIEKIGQRSIESKLLIALLKMQCLQEYMQSMDYKLVGKLNFNPQGKVIPCLKETWQVENEEYTFVTNGYLYFKPNKKNKNGNIIINCWADPDRGKGIISFFAKKNEIAEKMVEKAEKYIKNNNILIGSKIKDIDIFKGKFYEVNFSSEHTLKNYYYSDVIKSLFKNEIISLLKNCQEYKKMGITKRGFIFYGRPGTGKTTLGYIICNILSDYSVMWITPEMVAENGISSLKILYKLAKYISPCVIILEDLDLYAQDRGNMTGGVNLGSLMNILDGVNSIENCITIGTTNKISILEEALKNRPGRFDRIVKIGGLEEKLRKKMLKKHFKNIKKENKIIDYMIKKTDGWTGAEIQELINTININNFNTKQNNKITIEKVDKALNTMSNFGICIKNEKFGFNS